MSPDIGIIGGADGPTVFMISSQFPLVTIIGIAAAVAVIATVVVTVIFATRQ